jgi:hypothetical protein
MTRTRPFTIADVSPRAIELLRLLTDRRGDDECWPWLGRALNEGGYGSLYIGHYRQVVAHKVAWVVAGNALDGSLVLDHLCRNRRCVNPRHLEQVANKVNILRGESPPAQNARMSVCSKGHSEWAFLRRGPRSGTRQCAVCKRQRQREWRRHRALALQR